MASAPLSSRRARIALAIYAALTAAYLAFAARDRLATHTPFNHFALQARAWLDGRIDLGGPPPAYAMNNDFALFEGRWYVVFPAFPAVLLLPFVALAGQVEQVRDGLVFLWLAGVGPALLFVALERLRDEGHTRHDDRTNAALAGLFGLGTVYWFSAEQGTVWFAAHVVGVALAALYLAAAIGARHPFVAGLALGLGFLTRTPLLFAAPLFVLEARRVCLHGESPIDGRARFARVLALFAAPLAALLALSAAYNHVRFGAWGETGYRFLTVAWQARIARWGLFSYHYLARNLGVTLTSLPYLVKSASPDAPWLQISVHGLALWVTTPLYLALLYPRRRRPIFRALGITALCVAAPTLLYQNTGQVQFGQRFSNDYAVFLFAMLAVGFPRPRRAFWAAGLVGVLVNLYGTLTFDRPLGAGRYHHDPSNAIYQPD
jgi:hypothetical protein